MKGPNSEICITFRYLPQRFHVTVGILSNGKIQEK